MRLLMTVLALGLLAFTAACDTSGQTPQVITVPEDGGGNGY